MRSYEWFEVYTHTHSDFLLTVHSIVQSRDKKFQLLRKRIYANERNFQRIKQSKCFGLLIWSVFSTLQIVTMVKGERKKKHQKYFS